MTDSATTAPLLDHCNQLAASVDYEAVRNGLTQVISLLEQPGLGLNDSVRAYEVGRKLAEQCQKLLDAAELRITRARWGRQRHRNGTTYQPGSTGVLR